MAVAWEDRKGMKNRIDAETQGPENPPDEAGGGCIKEG
jgi:hypothetical protein